MIIYRALNKINNKSYIGYSTQDLKKRMREHLNASKLYDIKFYRAINKYGFDSFEWSILEECDNIKDALEKEIYYIKKYNTFIMGYNSTLGGEDTTQTKVASAIENWKISHKGYEHSDETKRKISIANKGKKPWSTGLNKYTSIKIQKMAEKISKSNKGKIFSEEHKLKISNANKGKKLSNETIKKIIKSRKNNGKNWHSNETKYKMSESAKGRVSNNKGKKMSEEQKIKISISNTKFINNETKNKVIKLYNAGISVYKISKDTSLTRYIVNKILKNMER